MIVFLESPQKAPPTTAPRKATAKRAVCEAKFEGGSCRRVCLKTCDGERHHNRRPPFTPCKRQNGALFSAFRLPGFQIQIAAQRGAHLVTRCLIGQVAV